MPRGLENTVSFSPARPGYAFAIVDVPIIAVLVDSTVTCKPKDGRPGNCLLCTVRAKNRPPLDGCARAADDRIAKPACRGFLICESAPSILASAGWSVISSTEGVRAVDGLVAIKRSNGFDVFSWPCSRPNICPTSRGGLSMHDANLLFVARGSPSELLAQGWAGPRPSTQGSRNPKNSTRETGKPRNSSKVNAGPSRV